MIQIAEGYLSTVAVQVGDNVNRIALLVCCRRQRIDLKLQIIVKYEIDINLILRNALHLQLPVALLRGEQLDQTIAGRLGQQHII
ncbi:hypothetical protein D3C71_2029360 [compost metagenome]